MRLVVRLAAVVASTIVLSLSIMVLLPAALFHIGFILGMTIVLVAVVSYPFKLSILEERNPSVKSIAVWSRSMGYLVEEKSGKVRVGIGRWVRIAVFSGGSGQGQRLYYKLDPTPLGWSTLLVCLLTFYLIPICAVILVYALARVSMFAERDLARTYKGDGRWISKRSEGIRGSLIDGLSEAYRLSSETLNAMKSHYHDLILVVALVVLLSWATTLFAITWTSWGYDKSIFPTIVAISAVTVLVLSVAFLLLHRKYAPRLTELDKWSKRLRDGTLAVTSGEWKRDDQLCAFDLLVETSAKMPTWMEYRRRSVWYRNPAASMLIFLLLLWGVIGIPTSLMAFWDLVVNALGLVLSVFAIVSGLYLYFRIGKNDEKEHERATADWNSRIENARQAIEKTIEDL